MADEKDDLPPTPTQAELDEIIEARLRGEKPGAASKGGRKAAAAAADSETDEQRKKREAAEAAEKTGATGVNRAVPTSGDNPAMKNR